jgi:hypothetical protein
MNWTLILVTLISGITVCNMTATIVNRQGKK